MFFHYLLSVFLSLSYLAFSVLADDEPVNVTAVLDSAYKKHSVFLIPGIFSSRIYAEYEPGSRWSKCFGEHNRTLIWMNTVKMQDKAQFKCIMEALTLRPGNDQGLNFSVGRSLEELEYLQSSLESQSDAAYFNVTVSMLLKANYSRSHIHSLAYDFRWIPENNHDRILPRWKENITTAFEKTGNRSVIICHSMGCKLTVEFIEFVGKDYLKKYIGGIFMLAGPYGGSVVSILSMIKGYAFGMEGLDAEEMELFRRAATKFPSTYYLLPKEEYFKDPFVIFENGTELFGTRALEWGLETYKTGYNKTMFDMYARSRTDLSKIRDILGPNGANVTAVCMYGKTEQSTIRYIDFRNKTHPMQNRTGDKAVNIESLDACRLFTKDKNVYPVENHDHMGIIQTQKAADLLMNMMDMTLKVKMQMHKALKLALGNLPLERLPALGLL